MTTLPDGRKLAALHECELSERVAALRTGNGGLTPALATILVGDDPSSATYERMKGNACRRVGMASRAITLLPLGDHPRCPVSIDQPNSDPAVHGILLQHRCRHTLTNAPASTGSLLRKTSTA